MGSSANPNAWADVVDYLTRVWIEHYSKRRASNEIVETTVSGFSYLFDISSERLLAAYGLSRGRHGEKRDASRMAGHPLGPKALYHRGHAIRHTLGGPTDINLVPQLGRINIGPFRELERAAVATPGSLYFTYWVYPSGDSQTRKKVIRARAVLDRVWVGVACHGVGGWRRRAFSTESRKGTNGVQLLGGLAGCGTSVMSNVISRRRTFIGIGMPGPFGR
jgi:hypothetical protein